MITDKYSNLQINNNMTITISPIDVNSNTWGDVINRVNQLITFASNNAVTAGGNTTVGDVVLNGSFTANVANIISVVATNINATTANVAAITANNGTINTLNVNTIPSFSSNNFSSNSATINNLNSTNANLINISSNNANIVNIIANTAAINSKLGISTNELRYVLTVGQPGTADGTTFNDRMIGVSGAGGAGYKLDDSTNNIRATFGTFGTNDVQIGTTTNHALIAKANNTSIARFATNGRIAIGSDVGETAPLTTLQVGGKISGGSSLSATRLNSGTSYTKDLTVIGADAGMRMWRIGTSETTVEYALGTTTNIADGNTKRWQTGINSNGYFIQDLTANANTYAMLVSNTGSISVGKGSVAADASALIELVSTNKGLLFPRMTTAQRNAISSAAEGLVVYDTTAKQLHYRNDSAWENLGGGSVRSVGLTMPAGFNVGSSPVTNTGVIAVTYASGYTGFTTALQTKLNGIEANAQVNTVTSVAGKQGAVTLVKGDVGLSNVDNTSDANKPVSSATQSALNLKANTAMLGALATKNKAAMSDLDTSGTANTVTYLRGDGAWSTLDLSGLGDMYKVVYDPTNQEKDAFNRANHTGLMPLDGLDPGANGAFVVGRSGSSGAVSKVVLASAATTNSVAFRATGGVLSVGTPTDNAHATTKLYTDTLANTVYANTVALIDGNFAKTLGTKSDITAGSDLNTFTDMGVYRCMANATAAGGSNFPAPYAGTLEVFDGGAGVMQRYTVYSSQATYGSVVYVRGIYSSTWGAWRRYIREEDLSTVATTGNYSDLIGSPALGNSATRNVGTASGTVAAGNDSRIVNAVQNTRQVIAGTGLTGGGALSSDVTLDVSYGTTAGTAAQGNDSRIVAAVPNTRQIIAGSGLTGGGTLAANRTLTVDFATVVSNIPDATTTIKGLVTLATDAQVRAATAGLNVVTAANLNTASSPVALTDATTVAVNWGAFITAEVTLAGNRTLGNPTKVQTGTTRYIVVKGNNATERTISFAANYKGDLPTDTVSSTKWLLIGLTAYTTTHIIVTSCKAL